MNNIPSEMNPLGHHYDRPWVQPIMTSNTTWSNNPTFGMTLSGFNIYGATDGRFPPYKAFDGKSGINFAKDHYGYILGTNYNPTSAPKLIMDFEKPLKIKKLTIFTGWIGVYAGNYGGNSSGKPGGEWVLFGDNEIIARETLHYCWTYETPTINDSSPSNNDKYELVVNVPRYCTRYQLCKTTAWTTNPQFQGGLRGNTIIDAVY